MKNKILYTLFLTLLIVNTVFAASVLDKKVNLVVTNISLEHVLQQISDSYQVRFSYINNVIPLQLKVSVSAHEKTLSAVLNKLFENTYIVYYAVGKHIVLKLASVNTKTSLTKNTKRSVGALKPIQPLDYSSPENLAVDAELKIYDIDKKLKELDSLALLENTISKTDSIGKLKLQQAIAIQIDKIKASTQHLVNGFNLAIDSLIVKDSTSFKKVNDILQKIEKKTVKLFVSADNKVDSIIAQKKLQHIYSLVPDSSGYYHRSFQCSFITPLGTNGLQSLQVINNMSLNIFAGANGGVDGFEAAGFLNIDKTDVLGLQVAGFANINAANTYGIQGSGFFNITAKNFKGAQLAGFVNVAGASLYGVQGAGFFNVTGKNVMGIQGAGFFNVAKNIKGTQAAGFFNVSNTVEGAQIAGFFNVAQNTKGTQVSGFFNTAKNLEGVQVAGFFNVANQVKGTQIAFLNFADTLQGVPIGFLSFVKKGYHKLDLYTNEAVPIGLAFRTGAKQFHNIIGVGVNTFVKQQYISVVYGLGTDIRLTNKLDLGIDLLAHDIRYLSTFPSNGNFFYVNNLGQLRLNAIYALTKKIAVFAGPTYSVYVTDIYNKDTKSYGMGFEPYTFYDRADGAYSLKMWIGGSLGVRFF